jgi:hypothetical protein
MMLSVSAFPPFNHSKGTSCRITNHIQVYTELFPIETSSSEVPIDLATCEQASLLVWMPYQITNLYLDIAADGTPSGRVTLQPSRNVMHGQSVCPRRSNRVSIFVANGQYLY